MTEPELLQVCQKISGRLMIFFFFFFLITKECVREPFFFYNKTCAEAFDSLKNQILKMQKVIPMTDTDTK